MPSSGNKLRSLSLFAVLSAAVISATIAPGLSFAQGVSQPIASAAAVMRTSQATPTAPGADAKCDVAPRSVDNLVTLVLEGTSSAQSTDPDDPRATPEPPKDGVPADESVSQAISKILQTQVACINDGDFLRQSALLTDDFLRRMYRGYFATIEPIDPDAVAQGFAHSAEPAPLPLDQQAHLESIQDVQVHPDGSVTAVSQINGKRNLVVFVQSDDDYLIDGSYELTPDATPEP